jgi:endo-1,4-beta-mannosidase
VNADADPAGAPPFRLGVNYWPADVAMDWLVRYDPVATRHDFARIAGAGMDTVRVFVRWEDVQPAPDRIDGIVLDRIVDAADAAEAAGVALIVTLFTGHMSGVNWIPRWATGGGGGDRRFRVVAAGTVLPSGVGMRNWYGNPEIVVAQERCARGVAGALAGHPAVWAWDLGNENSNCTLPPDAAAADGWLERLTTTLRSADPGCLVTVGTHMEDLEEDRGIGPAEAARWCDFVCMHGYPVYASWAAGPTDPSLVPFLALLTGWLAGGAPVLFEELGLPTVPIGAEPTGMLVEEAAVADYVGAVVDGLQEVGATGALLWCYSDYATALHDRPPFEEAVHERTFGLWRADGTPKPAVGSLAARRGLTRRPPPRELAWLDITVDEFAADRRGQLARLAARYRATLEER